jgi:hypothetical protein
VEGLEPEGIFGGGVVDGRGVDSAGPLFRTIIQMARECNVTHRDSHIAPGPSEAALVWMGIVPSLFPSIHSSSLVSFVRLCLLNAGTVERRGPR